MKQFAHLLSAAAGAAILKLSAGRIVTRTAARILSERRRAWMDHAAGIQSELDAERARGFGFRYCDGRRVNF